ncbi:MAG: hypothetical protein M3Z98_00685 [Candidatus Dormibacteraeota bacterium]|nr:hypothetical protein [Candidatus Dormibacteraeota bacterium]
MSTPTPPADIRAISTSRTLTVWFGRYIIALFTVLIFFTGSLPAMLFMIVVAEVLSLWRPTPALGPESYSDPMPAAWRTPMRVARLYHMASGCWSMTVIGVITTVIFGVITLDISRRPLGMANYLVAALVATWLLTRPVWYPAVRAQVSQMFQVAGKELAGNAPSFSVGTDGLAINFALRAIGSSPAPRSWVVPVAYAEIDEIRMLSALDAQAFSQSLDQYDPSLTDRSGLEFVQYVQGQRPRPSILRYLAGGAHVLIRGPSLLYLLAYADQTGPLAIAAWQAWRAAHPQPAGPAVAPA